MEADDTSFKEFQKLIENQIDQTKSNSWKKNVRLVLPHVGLVTVVCLYALIGAWVFYSLESPHEDRLKVKGIEKIKEMRVELVELVWQRYRLEMERGQLMSRDEWMTRVRHNLQRFNENLYRAYKDQYVRYGDVRLTTAAAFARQQSFDVAQQQSASHDSRIVRHRSSKSRWEKGGKLWTASSSLFFAATTMATIGYGNIVPVTTKGRIACIIFALFGAPLAIITIGDLGKFLSECTIWFYRRMKERGRLVRHKFKLWTLRKKSILSNVDDVESLGNCSAGVGDDGDATSQMDWDDMGKSEVPVLLVLAILLLYIAFGGVLFAVLESWTYMDAFYYCFVSLTTIGFGDLVPDRHEYIVLMLVYLGVGLAVTTMCIDLVGIQYIQKIHYFGRKFKGTDILQILRRKRMLERRFAMGDGELIEYVMQAAAIQEKAYHPATNVKKVMPAVRLASQLHLHNHHDELLLLDKQLHSDQEYRCEDEVLIDHAPRYELPLAQRMPTPQICVAEELPPPPSDSPPADTTDELSEISSGRSLMYQKWSASRAPSWTADLSSGRLSSDTNCSIISTAPSVHQRELYYDNMMRSPAPTVLSFSFTFPMPSPDLRKIAGASRTARRVRSCSPTAFRFDTTTPSATPSETATASSTSSLKGMACMQQWESFERMENEWKNRVQPCKRVQEKEAFVVVFNIQPTAEMHQVPFECHAPKAIFCNVSSFKTAAGLALALVASAAGATTEDDGGEEQPAADVYDFVDGNREEENDDAIHESLAGRSSSSSMDIVIGLSDQKEESVVAELPLSDVKLQQIPDVLFLDQKNTQSIEHFEQDQLRMMALSPREESQLAMVEHREDRDRREPSEVVVVMKSAIERPLVLAATNAQRPVVKLGPLVKITVEEATETADELMSVSSASSIAKDEDGDGADVAVTTSEEESDADQYSVDESVFDIDLGAFELVDSGVTAEALLRHEEPVIYHKDMPVHSVHHDTVHTEAAIESLMNAPPSVLSNVVPPTMVADNYCFVVDGDKISMNDIMGDDQWWRHTSRPTKYFYSEDLKRFYRVNCLTMRGGRIVSARLANTTPALGGGGLSRTADGGFFDASATMGGGCSTRMGSIGSGESSSLFFSPLKSRIHSLSSARNSIVGFGGSGGAGSSLVPPPSSLGDGGGLTASLSGGLRRAGAALFAAAAATTSFRSGAQNVTTTATAASPDNSYPESALSSAFPSRATTPRASFSTYYGGGAYHTSGGGLALPASATAVHPQCGEKVNLSYVYKVIRFYSFWKTCTSFHRIVTMIEKVVDDNNNNDEQHQQPSTSGNSSGHQLKQHVDSQRQQSPLKFSHKLMASRAGSRSPSIGGVTALGTMLSGTVRALSVTRPPDEGHVGDELPSSQRASESVGSGGGCPHFNKRIFVQYLWRNAKPSEKARVQKEFDPRRQRLLKFVTDTEARKRMTGAVKSHTNFSTGSVERPSTAGSGSTRGGRKK